MIRRARAALLLALGAVLLAAACDAGPVVTAPPAGVSPSPGPSGSAAAPTEEPFRAAAWPEAGSACGTEGYTGQPRADRGPGGADGGVHAVRAGRGVPRPRRAPGAGRPGRGRRGPAGDEPRQRPLAVGHRALPHRQVDAGRERAARPRRGGGRAPGGRAHARAHLGGGPDPADDRAPVGDRRRDRRAGSVGPRPDLDAARARRHAARRARDRLPRVRDRRRPGQGRGPARRSPGRSTGTRSPRGVRRGHEGGDPRHPVRDRGRLRGGRSGTASTPRPRRAALDAAGFDVEATYILHVPDRPVPGLPDPAGLAAAVKAQLETNVGLATEIDTMPVRDYLDDLATGKLDGLYLGGVASDDRRPGRLPRPAVRDGREARRPPREPPRRPTPSRRPPRRPTPPSAPRRSARRTTRSATPPPSSRSPTRAPSPRSAPT